MTLFGFLRRSRPASSADTAKERLQILLAHERADRSRPDYLPLLQKEILEVIKKYVQVESDSVDVRLQRGAEVSTLEVNIELPSSQVSSMRPSARVANAAFAR